MPLGCVHKLCWKTREGEASTNWILDFWILLPKADAHFASKNTLLKRNTLHCYILLKRTVCFKLACYSLLFNTLYPSTHFASWNVFLLSTVCFSTPFAPQNTLLLNTLCFSAHSAPQNTLLLSTLCFKEHFTPRNTLLLNTLCFLTPFAPWNTLLLRTLCSLTPFAPWNTLLLRTLCSLEHFAPQHIMLLGIHLTIMWNRCMKQDSDLNFRVKMSKKNCIRHVSESRHWKYSKKQSVPGSKRC